jgi:hypothetical protein
MRSGSRLPEGGLEPLRVGRVVVQGAGCDRERSVGKPGLVHVGDGRVRGLLRPKRLGGIYGRRPALRRSGRGGSSPRGACGKSRRAARVGAAAQPVRTVELVRAFVLRTVIDALAIGPPPRLARWLLTQELVRGLPRDPRRSGHGRDRHAKSAAPDKERAQHLSRSLRLDRSGLSTFTVRGELALDFFAGLESVRQPDT